VTMVWASGFDANNIERVGSFGVAAALLVYGVSRVETNGYSVGSSILARLGDASYAQYLLHPLIFMVVERTFFRSWIYEIGWLPNWLYLIEVLTILTIAALGMHYLFERPIIKIGCRLEKHMFPAPTAATKV